MQKIDRGEYEVFVDGRVYRKPRSLTRADGVTRFFRGGWVAVRVRKAGKGNGGGYVYIDLYENGERKTWLLHRLVALAFLPKPEGPYEVNHKDGVRWNNHVSNLEWVTHSDNQKHAYRESIRKHNGISPEKARYIWQQRNQRARTLKDISVEVGMSIQSISRIAKESRHALKP